MPGPYTGQHAFVFLSEEGDMPLATVIDNLQAYVDSVRQPQVGPVFFASLFEGPFRGFAHIAQDDAPALADFINGPLWDAGITGTRGTYVAEGRWHEALYYGPRPKGPWRKRHEFLAACQVYVNQPPLQVMRNIATAFEDPNRPPEDQDIPFVGGSTVFADFHLLIELGDHDREALDGHVASLRAVDGVVRVEVGFTEAVPTQSS
jgi:hypothetical protein